jgi:hypothetical protein
LHRSDKAGQALQTMIARLARQLGLYEPPGTALTFPPWEAFPQHLKKKGSSLGVFLRPAVWLAGNSCVVVPPQGLTPTQP